jgi:hypothetical protein
MVRVRLLFLVAALAALPAAGCKSAPDPQEQELNELWREGYGFNNPNAERIQKGLKPLNFDGSQ